MVTFTVPGALAPVQQIRDAGVNQRKPMVDSLVASFWAMDLDPKLPPLLPASATAEQPADDDAANLSPSANKTFPVQQANNGPVNNHRRLAKLQRRQQTALLMAASHPQAVVQNQAHGSAQAPMQFIVPAEGSAQHPIDLTDDGPPAPAPQLIDLTGDTPPPSPALRPRQEAEPPVSRSVKAVAKANLTRKQRRQAQELKQVQTKALFKSGLAEFVAKTHKNAGRPRRRAHVGRLHAQGRPQSQYVPPNTVARRSLLRLPDTILARIAKELFPPGDVKIVDWPKHLAGRLPESQTTYRLAGRDERVTYVGWKLGYASSDFRGSARDVPRLGFSPEFLTLNRKLYEIGVQALYERWFRFGESIESCLAFLHDHPKQEHVIGRMQITCDFSVNPYTWRRLFNQLVHVRYDLRKLQVDFRAEFWQQIPWKNRRFSEIYSTSARVAMEDLLKLPRSLEVLAENKEITMQSLISTMLRYADGLCSTMYWGGLTHPFRERDDFRVGILFQLARLPKTARAQKRCIRLQIDGSDADDERKAFYQALVAFTRCLGRNRPDLVEEPRQGVCTQKMLEYSCYWDEGNAKSGRCKAPLAIQQALPVPRGITRRGKVKITKAEQTKVDPKKVKAVKANDTAGEPVSSRLRPERSTVQTGSHRQVTLRSGRILRLGRNE